MPNYFPCPNSQCTYQFDAEILPPAAMVTCPLCRTKFPYRASQSVSTPAAATVEAPASDAPADPPLPPGQRLVHLRDAPRSSVLPTILWVGGFCLVLGLFIVGLAMRGRTMLEEPSDAKDEKFNLQVEAFPSHWQNNVDAQKPVNGNILGRKRTGPDAWIAVAAQDWVDRHPRSGELDDLMRSRLRGAFTTLEVEPIEGETWAGHPAMGMRFTGSLDDVAVRGVAYAIAYKGIGYVYFAWAAEGSWADVRDEAAALREKVKPANFREKWVAKKPNSQVFELEGYKVEDPDGAWIKAKPADEWTKADKLKYPIDDVKTLDPAAVLAFRAQYRIREHGDSQRRPAEATALVLELPEAGDPLEAARAYSVERIKKQFAGDPPEVKLEPMNRAPSGTALPTGGPAIGRFLFASPVDQHDRVMYIISAISVGGKTITVETRCQERDASYVEEWMIHLAGSLKAK